MIRLFCGDSAVIGYKREAGQQSETLFDILNGYDTKKLLVASGVVGFLCGLLNPRLSGRALIEAIANIKQKD